MFVCMKSGNSCRNISRNLAALLLLLLLCCCCYNVSCKETPAAPFASTSTVNNGGSAEKNPPPPRFPLSDQHLSAVFSLRVQMKLFSPPEMHSRSVASGFMKQNF